jgi:hypothetical protein
VAFKIRRDLVPIVSAYAEAFESKAGQIVIDDLEISFGGSCYTKGDSHDTAYKEGQRDVLMRIKQMISYSGLEVEEEEQEEGSA